MSTVEITKGMAEGSSRTRSRFVVAYYVLSIVTGAIFFFVHGRLASAVEFGVAVLYVAATAIFYSLSVGSRIDGSNDPRAQRGS